MRKLIPFAIPLTVIFGVVATPVSASPSHKSMDKLTVKITTTGSTVWGKVTVSWKSAGKTVSKSCHKASCKWTLPAMTKLTLKQTPTNAGTWPFKHWIVSGKGMKTSTKTGQPLKVTLTGNDTVTAVYVLA